MSPPRLDCPYGAHDCPKVKDLDNEIATLHKRMLKIEQTTYIIIGMIAIDYGLVLF